MIEQLNPNTRELVVESRCLAMKGKAKEAIKKLDGTLKQKETNGDLISQIALTHLKAEILHLDCRDSDSLAVFDNIVVPKSYKLSSEVSLIVADNRNLVGTTLFEAESFNEFYHLLDHRRMAGIRLWESEEVLAADEAATAGRHYDALPAYWQLLLKAYRLSSWRAFRWAASRMCTECLELGWPHEAAYYAVVGLNCELAGKVGDALLAKCDPKLIRNTVERLVSTGNLCRHAAVACIVFGRIGDALPDDKMDLLVSWLVHKCSAWSNGWAVTEAFKRAWDALGSIVHRLSSDQARKVVRLAVGSDVWKKPSESRKALIGVVNRCTTVLPGEDFQELADMAVPLATKSKSDLDFVQSINLLCNIADRGGDRVKSMIGKALYPKGHETSSAILVQVAPVFGKRIEDPKSMNEAAHNIARNIRMQVQRLEAHEEPEVVSGTFGSVFLTENGKKIVVQLASTVSLEAVTKYRDLLDRGSVQLLLDAVLSMLKEPENILGNKVGLIQSLKKFGDILTREQAKQVFNTLAPLASGEVSIGNVGMKWAQSQHPLSPFKMRDASPGQVSGSALYALAHIERKQPGVYFSSLTPILEKALTDTDVEIRRSAFVAAREVPRLSEPAITGILFGTRDPDSQAAAEAFYAIATKDGLKLTQNQWELLIYSLTEAVHSPDTSLRRSASFTVARFEKHTPETARLQLARLRKALDQDVCYSVRTTLEKETEKQVGASDKLATVEADGGRKIKIGTSREIATKPTSARKEPGAKSARTLTATEQVLNIIKRNKKGADVPTLKKRTGFEDQKIRNIVFRATEQGKIKRVRKGVYVKA